MNSVAPARLRSAVTGAAPDNDFEASRSCHMHRDQNDWEY